MGQSFGLVERLLRILGLLLDGIHHSMAPKSLGFFIHGCSTVFRYLAHLLAGLMSQCSMLHSHITGQGFGSTRLWLESIHSMSIPFSEALVPLYGIGVPMSRCITKKLGMVSMN